MLQLESLHHLMLHPMLRQEEQEDRASHTQEVFDGILQQLQLQQASQE